MICYINNTPQEIPAPCTITELLASLTLVGQRGLAVAVNDAVVARPEWVRYCLQTNDRLTLIRATQGG